jgi:hypothetical protein
MQATQIRQCARTVYGPACAGIFSEGGFERVDVHVGPIVGCAAVVEGVGRWRGEDVVRFRDVKNLLGPANQ